MFSYLQALTQYKFSTLEKEWASGDRIVKEPHVNFYTDSKYVDFTVEGKNITEIVSHYDDRINFEVKVTGNIDVKGIERKRIELSHIFANSSTEDGVYFLGSGGAYHTVIRVYPDRVEFGPIEDGIELDSHTFKISRRNRVTSLEMVYQLITKYYGLNELKEETLLIENTLHNIVEVIVNPSNFKFIVDRDKYDAQIPDEGKSLVLDKRYELRSNVLEVESDGSNGISIKVREKYRPNNYTYVTLRNFSDDLIERALKIVMGEIVSSDVYNALYNHDKDVEVSSNSVYYKLKNLLSNHKVEKEDKESYIDVLYRFEDTLSTYNIVKHKGAYKPCNSVVRYLIDPLSGKDLEEIK